MFLEICDMFSGSGGATEGMKEAARKLGLKLRLTAINHSPLAIKTHSTNHPDARHLNENLDSVNPFQLYPKGHLDGLWASPACTHFSRARGGQPHSEQSRAAGFHILRWADALRIDRIILENVPEWQDWGPLDDKGKPIKSKRGQIFKAFINSLEALGYLTEFRILTAANYGDPTTRQRLFVLASRIDTSIRWPEIEFTQNGAPTLWGETKKWKPLHSIIDWSLPAEPVDFRKKTLVRETVQRIETGIQLFGGNPFVVKYYGTGGYCSQDRPLDTVTTKDRFGLAFQRNARWHYRMLQPPELAKSMSFPPDYIFQGNRAEQIHQIGNAVPVKTAAALFESMMAA